MSHDHEQARKTSPNRTITPAAISSDVATRRAPVYFVKTSKIPPSRIAPPIVFSTWTRSIRRSSMAVSPRAAGRVATYSAQAASWARSQLSVHGSRDSRTRQI